MNIVYLVLAHTGFEQLRRCCAQLDAEHISFAIHVDGKIPEKDYVKIRALFSGMPRVTFCSKRHRVRYLHFSMIEATLECIKEAFRGGVAFDYAFLLSGTTYPIKNNQTIRRFLQESAGKEFLKNYRLPRPAPAWRTERGGLDRILKWWWEFRGEWFFVEGGRLRNRSAKALPKWLRLFSPLARFLKDRVFLDTYKPYGGSQWWCLSRPCLEEVLRVLRQQPKVKNYFKYSFCPDEIFFQTLVMNSPYAAQVQNDNLSFVEWMPDGARPQVLTMAHFEKLKDSPALFARKLDAGVDPKLLDQLERQFLRSTV